MEAVDDFSEFRKHKDIMTLRFVEFYEGGADVRRFFSNGIDAIDYINKLHAAGVDYKFRVINTPDTMEGFVDVLNKLDPFRSAFDSDVIPF